MKKLLLLLTLGIFTFNTYANNTAAMQINFGVDVYNYLLQSKKENTLISPYSLYAAMLMAQNGAGDKKVSLPIVGVESSTLPEENISTLQEFSRALKQDKTSLDDVNQGINEIARRLEDVKTVYVKNIITKKLQLKEPFVRVNNAIWANSNRFRFDNKYVSKMANPDTFNAEAKADPFPGVKGDLTVDKINSWVEKNTRGPLPPTATQAERDNQKGLIQNVLSETKNQWAGVLINTLYVEGNWEQPFQDVFTSKTTKPFKNKENRC